VDAPALGLEREGDDQEFEDWEEARTSVAGECDEELEWTSVAGWWNTPLAWVASLPPNLDGGECDSVVAFRGFASRSDP
jgi:hypothetical protein